MPYLLGTAVIPPGASKIKIDGVQLHLLHLNIK